MKNRGKRAAARPLPREQVSSFSAKQGPHSSSSSSHPVPVPASSSSSSPASSSSSSSSSPSSRGTTDSSAHHTYCTQCKKKIEEKRKHKRHKLKKFSQRLTALVVAILIPLVIMLIAMLATGSSGPQMMATLPGGALSVISEFRDRVSSEWLPKEMLKMLDSSLAPIEQALINLTQAFDHSRPGLRLARQHPFLSSSSSSSSSSTPSSSSSSSSSSFTHSLSATSEGSLSSDPSIEEGESEQEAEVVVKDGLKPKHPIVMVPGVVSGALELWEGKPCAASFFRERLWGRTSMIQLMLSHPMCWIQHMSLEEDGTDPPGIKVRPALGLDAADWLFPGYWVWAHLIQNLADLGYDSFSMSTGAYDWRLPLVLVEQRDHSFSMWMNQIELKLKLTGEKSVLISHSYGAAVTFYFLRWCESEGGVGWVNEHIASWVNIGGPLLGAHKAISTYLSAEMRDTAQMHPVVGMALDQFVSQSVRLSLLRSWASGLAMFPKGADQIWGSEESGAPDDIYEDYSIGGVVWLKTDNGTQTLDAYQALQLLKSASSDKFKRIIDEMHSWGVDPDAAFNPQRWTNKPAKWTNVLETPLPNAPNMTVYCLYGVGKQTERGFHYHDSNPTAGTLLRNGKMGPSIPYHLATSISNPRVNLQAGVQQGDGDGTVPLLSMGYMCHSGWKLPGLNPGNVRTVVREYPHLPVSSVLSPRGTPTTGDHVDILGNHDLITDVLAISAGHALEDQIISELPRFSEKIQLRTFLPDEN